jgi:hypothetical protein
VEAADEEHTGVLVLRAWVELDDELRLRVRVTRTIRGRTSEPVSSASATIEGVCAIVRAWLEELMTSVNRKPQDRQ